MTDIELNSVYIFLSNLYSNFFCIKSSEASYIRKKNSKWWLIIVSGISIFFLYIFLFEKIWFLYKFLYYYKIEYILIDKFFYKKTKIKLKNQVFILNLNYQKNRINFIFI